MTLRKIDSVILIGLMVISNIAMLGTPLFDFGGTQILEIGDFSSENGSDLDITEDEIDNLQQPLDAAYYKGLLFQNPRITLDIEPTLPLNEDNTFILDVAEGTSNYYFTGYTINLTSGDNNHTLFVLRTDKSGGNRIAVSWRNASAGYIPTGGKAIALSGSRVYVGGYYNMTVQNGFTSYGSGILLCYDLALNLQWARNDYSYDTRVNNYTAAPGFEFGGERIEDVMVMPDGNVTICGSHWKDIFNGFKGIHTFVAKLDGDNGDIIWQYNKDLIHLEGVNQIFTSVGRKLYYNQVSQKVVVLGDIKQGKQTITPSIYYYAVNQYITFIDYNSQTAYLTRTSIEVTIGTQITTNAYNELILGENPNYTHIKSLAYDTSMGLWACGVTYAGTVSTIGTSTVVVWVLNSDGNRPVSGYERDIPAGIVTNSSAIFIFFDTSNTLYLAGTFRTTPSPNQKLWFASIDPDNSMRLITTQTDNTACLLTSYVFDATNRQFILVGYQVAGPQYDGFLHKVITDTNIPAETLTSLDPITNIHDVVLTWTNTHSILRYFWIYRTTSIVANFNGLTPIASLERQYTYTDTSTKTDTVIYYYYLVCGNDYDNNSALQYDDIQYYRPPDSPFISITPANTIIGNNVTFQWARIYNASFQLYAAKTSFTIAQISGMSPITGVEWNTNITQAIFNASYQPTSLGMWYFRIVAVNSTRGNSVSNIVSSSVEQIAVHPASLTAIVINSGDGIVSLNWPDVSGCNYIVYKRINQTFDINTPNTEYQLVTTRFGETNSQYTVTGLSSGTWYFAIWAWNSTGYALQFSVNAQATIARIPFQPNIYLSTKNPHTTSNVGLVWTPNDNESDYFVLYRIYSTSGTDLIYSVEGLTPIYNGTALAYADSEPKKDGYYIYVVIAVNENGFREPDIADVEKYVVATVKTSDNSLLNSGLITGLIIGGVILVGAGIAFTIYKKRNPWA